MLYLVRIALVLFAIGLLQRSFIYEVRSIFGLDMQFSASLSMEIYSDISYFPVIVASDAAKLEFDVFPNDSLEYAGWFNKTLLAAQDCPCSVRKADNKQENYSLQLPVLMGLYWNMDENLWPADEADIGELTPDAILVHTLKMPLDEQELLKEDSALMIFNHAPTHSKAQISLRQAILAAFPGGHPLFNAVQAINKGIGAADLYQGSSIFVRVRETVSNILLNDRSIMSTEAMKISREVVQCVGRDLKVCTYDPSMWN